MELLISLIIPVYKVEKFIAECVKSVMDQTYDYFECIFVDDKTPDNSIQIAEQLIERYQGNIKFDILHHDVNKGLPNARNTGIKHATGQYVMFLDSDDTLTPYAIQTMIDIISQYKGVDLVQCGIHDDKRKIYDITLLPSFLDRCHSIFYEFINNHIPWMVHGKLVRMDFIRNMDLLFDEKILIHEDLYWSYFICQKASTFASSPTIVYNYNTNNVDSIMQQSELNFQRSAHYYIVIINRLLSHIDKENYTDNRMFLLNFFFYVAECIRQSYDITPETNKAFTKLRYRFLFGAIRKVNLFEILYDSHLFMPFCKLLNVIQYRRTIIYKFEKLACWYYRNILHLR